MGAAAPAGAPSDPYRGSAVNLGYLCLRSRKVIISAYLWESSGETGGGYCIKPLYCRPGWHSFCAKGWTFSSSLWPTNNMTRSFVFPFRLWISLCCIRISRNTEKMLYSFGRSLKRHAAPCYVLLWGINRMVLCLRLTSSFTFLPFWKLFLCVVLMSTIPPSWAAAAGCSASSYLWLHAALAELARDSSSHSGRLSFTGETKSIFLIGIKSLSVSKWLNKKQDWSFHGGPPVSLGHLYSRD